MPAAAIPLTERHRFLPPGLAPDTQSGLVMEVVSYDMIRVYIISHVFYLLYCHIRSSYILIPIPLVTCLSRAGGSYSLVFIKLLPITK